MQLHDIPPGARVVNYRAENNAYGRVYHQPHCFHVANMCNGKVMTWEDASSRGREPCLCCHPASMKRLLCPTCLKRGHAVLLKRVGLPDSARMALACPQCKLQIQQAEEVP